MPGGENVANFPLMTASVTDLRRKTTELLDEVKRGKDVEIESHGKPVARLAPGLKTISFGQIADMMERAGGDPETAAAVEAEIQKSREARLHDALD